MKKLNLTLNTLIFLLSFALLQSKSIEISALDNKTNLEVIPDYIRVENAFLGLDTTIEVKGQTKINFDFGIYTDVIDENNLNSSNLISYIIPNPASTTSVFDVNLKDESNLNLELFDLLGNSLISSNLYLNSGIHRFILNIQSLKNGVYFIKANIGSKSKTSKLIVNSTNLDNNSNLQFEHISSSANFKGNEIQSLKNYTFTCSKKNYKSESKSFSNDSIPSNLVFALKTVMPFLRAVVSYYFESVNFTDVQRTYSGGSYYDQTNKYTTSLSGSYEIYDKNAINDTLTPKDSVRLFYTSPTNVNDNRYFICALDELNQIIRNVDFSRSTYSPTCGNCDTLYSIVNFSFVIKLTNKWVHENGRYKATLTGSNFNQSTFPNFRYSNSGLLKGNTQRGTEYSLTTSLNSTTKNSFIQIELFER